MNRATQTRNLTKHRSIIGPVIGGALARPCIFYPTIFRPGSIWDRFPYLLPNLFSAAAVCCGLIVGILFLEETHSEKRKQRDRGLELGRKLASHCSWRRNEPPKSKMDEEQPLLGPDEQLPGYTRADNSLCLGSEDGPALRSSPDLMVVTPKRALEPNWKQVVLSIVSFGILAL